MAKKVFYQLVDDLDGTTIESGAGETITFGLDGASYEIDLTNENAASLREGLARFVHGARVTARKTGGRRGSGNAGSGRDLAAIRSWAEANGHTVAKRGRIPGAVIDAYDGANG